MIFVKTLVKINKAMVAMFFNSIFLSIDTPIVKVESFNDDENLMFLQIEDTSEPYNQVFS